jgi:hypothetical protein
MFAPSPRVEQWGLHIVHSNGYATFGVMLPALALAGLALAWRRRSAWLLALTWIGAAALALGSDLRIAGHDYTPVAHAWHGVQVSLVMPFTWLVGVPGFAAFRTPSRIAELGLLPAALLAGYAVNWLRYRAVPVALAALALAVLELGSPAPPVPTMPTALPALDGPIAADHSGSIVADVPFGLRGGVGITGQAFPPETEVLATADGHPLADAFLSRVPPVTANGIAAEPFYGDLMQVQSGAYRLTPAQLAAAAQNARAMHVGWVVLWRPADTHLRSYLRATGFTFAYQADGAWVYRSAP